MVSYKGGAFTYVDFRASGATAGDPLVGAFSDISNYTPVTTSGYTVGVYFHGCLVAASATDRRAYINGGSKGTSTQSHTPTVTSLSIGCNADTNDAKFQGTIAEVRIYDRALTDPEVANLANVHARFSLVNRRYRRTIFPSAVAAGNRRRRFLVSCGA